MTKFSSSLLLLLATVFFISCKQSFKETSSGLQYKIVEKGSGPVAGTGSTVKLHYRQLVHDTVTKTTFGMMPVYKALIPGTIFPYDPFEALTAGVREGDSIVVVMRMDSLLKKGKIEKLPPNLSPEDQFVTCIKVLKVFPFDFRNAGTNDSLLNVDRMAERKRIDDQQTILGPQRIEAYLQQKKIVAPSTIYGTYLQVIAEGAGVKVDSGMKVSLKFSIHNLNGRLLDTNMDTTFHHTGPLEFEIGSPYMMKPVDETLRLLRKGAHARIFIPAMLINNDAVARGTQPSGYDDMVFEVIVIDDQL